MVTIFPYLCLLGVISPLFGQRENLQKDSPKGMAVSSYRYERQIHDSNGDGWCDIWCSLFSYDPAEVTSEDTDGDGVSDHDEMIHMRNPFQIEAPEKIRSAREITQLRELRSKPPKKKFARKLHSSKWKTKDQIVDFKKIKQGITPRQLQELIPQLTRQMICDPAANPLGDDDEDGMTNLQELAQGLPPCDADNGDVPAVIESQATVVGESHPAIQFRALEVPDLTYGCQVQESLDLQNWEDVDMYANRTGIVNVPAGNGAGNIDLVTVRSSLPFSDGPRAFMRVSFRDKWPPQPLEFAAVSLGDIVSHARDNTLSILPDNTLHKEIYDFFSSSSSNVEWARFSWTNQLDLRGVTFDQNRTCTLISPRHVLMAAHFPRGTNSTIRFHTRDGLLITRTITAVLSTEGIGEGTNQCRNGRDISVGLLDSPLTDIPFYRVFPPRIDWPQHLKDSLALVTRWNNREILVRRAAFFTGGSNATRHITFSLDTEVPSFYEGGVSGGDSGNPSFVLIRGEPVLCHILSCGNTRGPFLGDPEIYTVINQFMSDLGGGHQLTPIFLSP